MKNKKYMCKLLNTSYLNSTENQLNKLFKDGWFFHSVFTVGLAHGGTADYVVLYKQGDRWN
jgi:hypothetical protein